QINRYFRYLVRTCSTRTCRGQGTRRHVDRGLCYAEWRESLGRFGEECQARIWRWQIYRVAWRHCGIRRLQDRSRQEAEHDRIDRERQAKEEKGRIRPGADRSEGRHLDVVRQPRNESDAKGFYFDRGEQELRCDLQTSEVKGLVA